MNVKATPLSVGQKMSFIKKRFSVGIAKLNYPFVSIWKQRIAPIVDIYLMKAAQPIIRFILMFKYKNNQIPIDVFASINPS